ncbi:MAG: phosphoserine phosphatase SerB [Burkholderiaceae bacterium]
MSRLVVQGAELTNTQISEFCTLVGNPSNLRNPSLAIWRGVKLNGSQITPLADRLGVDAEIVPDKDSLTNYRLIVFDMDSTLITVECIDEIADFAGKKKEVAAITEAAMRGELDFNAALNQRLALLEGLDECILQTVYDERVRCSPGAQTLIAHAHQAGLQSLIVSGGFTWFTERLAKKLNMHHHRANKLEIVNNKLTGRTEGAVIDAQKKQDTVLQTCSLIGCTPEQTIVIGDGANDLRMMAIAGISVAYHAKPIVRSETKHAVNHCGLDSILNYFSDV